MKKRLYLITFLIGVAIGFTIIDSKLVSSFQEGVMDGLSAADKKREGYDVSTYVLHLEPKAKFTKPTTLLDAQSGEWLPARIYMALIEAPSKEKSGWFIVLWSFLGAVFAFAGVIMWIFNFMKFIFAVHKSIIFEWINVKRFRRIGIGFIIQFAGSTFLRFVTINNALKAIKLADYNIVQNHFYDGGSLLLGMIALLLAEVFAVGLRLKEEQELTI